MTTTTAYIGLGSNAGDRRGSIQRALDRLAADPEIEIAAMSALIETEAVGDAGPAPFLNAAAEVRTTLTARGLLDRCRAIELASGRATSGPERAGPRAIDLDVLLFGDLVCEEPGLTVPHPRMHERGFVLAPLAEIAPDARHPRLDRSISQLLDVVSLI